MSVPARVGMPAPMTASPAASTPASAIQARDVAGAVARASRRPRRSGPPRSIGRSAVRAARRRRTARRPARGRARRLVAERHVVVHGEARVALADRSARDRPPARGRRRRRAARVGLGGEQLGRPAEVVGVGMRDQHDDARARRAPARAAAARPSRRRARPVSTTSTASSPRDHDLADDARAVVLLAGPDAVGELADHAGAPIASRSRSTSRGAVVAGAGGEQRARLPRRTRSSRSKSLERAEREGHRRDAGALDEQLLEALGERPARGAGDAIVERRRQQGDQAERLRSPHGDAPLVDLLAGRVALGQPLRRTPARRRCAVASRSRSSIQRGRGELELAGRALARAAQVGREHRPAAPRGRAGAAGDASAAALPRSSSASSTPGAASSQPAGSSSTASSVDARRDAELEALARSRLRAATWLVTTPRTPAGATARRGAPPARRATGCRPARSVGRTRLRELPPARGWCRRVPASASPGRRAASAHVRLGARRLGARDVVRDARTARASSGTWRLRRRRRPGRGPAASAARRGIAHGGVQPVAARDLDERHGPSPERGVHGRGVGARPRARPRSGTAGRRRRARP